MWTFVVSGSDGKATTYVLIKARTYTLGRKGNDILVHQDKAVSRLHAEFVLSHGDHGEPSMLLVDKSKTGTIVNKDRYTGKSVKLKDGDRLELGVTNTQILVKFTPLSILCSGIRRADRKKLQSDFTALGAKVVESIYDATYLVMQSIEVTSKVMLALLRGVPIVSPEYFRELEKRDSGFDKPLPDPKDFLPPISDTELSPSMFDSSLSNNRKTLFLSKTFVFLNADQHKNASEIVAEAGGESILLANPIKNDEKFKKKHANHIFVEPFDVKEDDEELKKQLTSLHEMGIRIVGQNDIGFAILHANSKFVVPDEGGDKKENGTEKAKVAKSSEESESSSEKPPKAKEDAKPSAVVNDKESSSSEPEEKKPEKKAEDKKSDDKKSDERKSDDKKSDEKKSDEEHEEKKDKKPKKKTEGKDGKPKKKGTGTKKGGPKKKGYWKKEGHW